MFTNNERDLCIYKNFSEQRNPKRIPIICSLINKLWIKQRRHKKNAGLCYLIAMIQSLSHNENGGDPFYWEEDRWYDFLDNLIERTSNDGNVLSIDQLATMSQIVKYFENYWSIYPDLRLYQIFDLVFSLVDYKIENEIISVDYWISVLVTEEILILKNSIKSLKDNLENISNNEDIILRMGMTKEQYKNVLLKEINKTQQKLDELMKEYDLDETDFQRNGKKDK